MINKSICKGTSTKKKTTINFKNIYKLFMSIFFHKIMIIIYSRKVRIDPSVTAAQTGSHPSHRPTGFVRPSNINDSDTDVQRQSVLTRLYDDVIYDDEVQGPTLKDYKWVYLFQYKIYCRQFYSKVWRSQLVP